MTRRTSLNSRLIRSSIALMLLAVVAAPATAVALAAPGTALIGFDMWLWMAVGMVGLLLVAWAFPA